MLRPSVVRSAWGRRLPLLVGALLGAAGLATTTPGHAEIQLDGRWKQSALREDFTIQQWLDAGCGPPPHSATTGGGEIIGIRTEGDELSFVGGGRVYRTNQCYDPMPTLSRESHSRASDGKTWRTRCVTPPGDPRKTVLNTLVVATSDTRIDLVETGRYEITLENGRCMADVKRTRSYTLVTEENGSATPPATPAPVPTTKDPDPPKPAVCRTPGEPSRLEVRPSKKLLRTGETFKFRGLVLDANGCNTGTATTWRISAAESGKGVTVDAAGTVTVAKDAAEGTVEVVATAAGKDARVVVEVASPARYDELLAHSGLNAAGENDQASTATIASQSLGAGEGRVEDRSRERRLAFLGIVGGVLVVLSIAAVIVVRRSRRAKELMTEAEERHEARVQEVLDRRRQRETAHAAQMRAHEENVRAAKAAERHRPSASVAASAPLPGGPGKEKLCTSCGREFPASTSFCPHDGMQLVAASKAALHYAVQAGGAQRSATSRGKICPTCGERFDGAADFCGKDGTQLVLLN